MPGLPDGSFSNQKFKFGYILEGLGIKNVVIFLDHLEYFTATWYNLWPFGIVCGRFGTFFPVLVYSDQEKSGNPGQPSTDFLFAFESLPDNACSG
jgi:hypothetical protein